MMYVETLRGDIDVIAHLLYMPQVDHIHGPSSPSVRVRLDLSFIFVRCLRFKSNRKQKHNNNNNNKKRDFDYTQTKRVLKPNKKMKTTKGGKVMNPTDAYRKELRKRELKRVITH
jgi:hypothetical protein